MSDNSTSSAVTQLPASILEAFLPGYGVLSRFLLDSLGIDVTSIVSAGLLIFALVTALKFSSKYIYEYVRHYFMSYIRIDHHDDIYDHVMEWVASQTVSRNARNLIAKTGHENHWEVSEDEDQQNEQIQGGGLLNFRSWDLRKPPKFEPSYGIHFIWHNRNFFMLQRDQKTTQDSGGWGYIVQQNSEFLTLSCLGRSTQPIKNIIREARDFYLSKQKACTTVRRPAPKQSRNYRTGNWIRAATRPSRPMDTVILEANVKDLVLSDVNEYLHPATPRWYSNRGIPYRRGYLLYGPPGTGKSSLAWALAGVFGLDIYVISLADPQLDESELAMLFTSLPRRCFVLLEDIDSAGLRRQEELSGAKEPKNGSEASKIGAEISKAFESVKKNSDKEKQGISLSGLLNSIDGVASHEGRVLIMTTNHLEKLDDALIRPGRIDMKVPFTNASSTQIRELFTRMYSRETHSEPTQAASERTVKSGAANHEKKIMSGPLSHGDKPTRIHTDLTSLTPPDTPRPGSTPIEASPKSEVGTEQTLDEIAQDFAAKIPALVFTPAEIQGFLLTHKRDPLKALAKAGEFRDELLAAKEKKKAASEQQKEGKESQ